VCDGLGRPASVAHALAMLDRALDHLNAADAGSLPSSVQAEALRALERAGAKHTAARARMLGAFAGQAAYEDDGHGSARTWLKWRTRVTAGAAAGAVGWVRRLEAHPVIGGALAAGDLSESWAKQISAWTDRLPIGRQDDADEILAAAARAGAELAGLAGLAQEMYERSHADRDGDGDGGFGDRTVWLDTTLGGAGRLTGDLTPACSAALAAVLESLGKRAGPEDIRTVAQRRHDALEEACRRLIAAGMLPDRAGQPTQVQLHMTLAQLRGATGASAAEATWAAARASQPGWVTGSGADGAACDTTVVPIVTGHVDWLALDRLTEVYLAYRGLRPAGSPGIPSADDAGAASSADPGAGDPADPRTANPADPETASPADPSAPNPADPSGANPADPSAADPAGRGAANRTDPRTADTADPEAANRTGPGRADPGTAGQFTTGRSSGHTCGCTCGGCTCPARVPLSPATLARLRQTMLRLAADVMSGPTGLASWLRASQLTGATGGTAGPGASPSLPLAIPLTLDIGEAEPTIPAHLRRAVLARHRHCTYPGCRVPAAFCEIHHYIPWSRGGRTALGNLGPVCPFHHKIVVHRWGWTLTLHPDGEVTATSPDGRRTLRDHDPPSKAA
jgi:uncharacterized protein DUF222/HNH endonuclease